MKKATDVDTKGSVPARDIDGYLAALPLEKRALLGKLRQTIQAAAPQAEEAISYQMPAFKYRGHPLVYFAAFQDHCSFFPASKSLVKKFSRELKPYKTSAGTIQFTSQNPLPAALVTQIIKARIAELESHIKA